MKVTIVTIGDEILIGQIVDTNSAWMADKLTLSGFDVIETRSIADNASQIKATLDNTLATSDVVLLTGGIGPTRDDITKSTLCEYFNTTLVFDDAVLENIENIISNRYSLNELTRNQAYVPRDCTVIQNRVGTAPITWFEKDKKVLVSMPGVPYEMKYVMETEILLRLQTKYEMSTYHKKVYLVAGYGESALAIRLNYFEDNLPENMGLAYLPSPNLVRLRLFIRGGEEQKSELEKQGLKIEKLLGDAIISHEDISLEELLGNVLLQKGLSLSTAESCTGGNIAHLITNIPGASQYYKGSVVAYTPQIKVKELEVSSKTIDKYTVVSKQVVEEMAQGIATKYATDCSIAVSGIAGPGGATDENPVGTVWICTLCKGNIKTEKYQLGKYRDANIMRASNIAILQLLKIIDEMSDDDN